MFSISEFPCVTVILECEQSELIRLLTFRNDL